MPPGRKRRKTYLVKLLQGTELKVAAANIEPVDGLTKDSRRSPLAVRSLVKHITRQGYFFVSKILEDCVLIQDCLSSAVHRSDISDLYRVPDESADIFFFKAILRDYQYKTIDFILSQRRSINILNMGAGKTIVGFGTYLRLRYDTASPLRLQEGDIFLVLTEANLVHEVWAKEASKFGLLKEMHLKLVGTLPEDRHLVVDSYQNFWTHVSGEHCSSKIGQIYDPVSGTLWNRPIVGLFLDEVHRLSGVETWNKVVTEISRRASLVAGVTGTFFSNEPEKAANMCRAVGLSALLLEKEYWREDNALAKAKDTVGGIYEVGEEEIIAEAPKRARVPLCKTILYEGHVGKRQCDDSLAEILGVAASEAAEFHRLPAKEDKIKCLVEHYKPWLKPSSKMHAFLRVTEDLLEGRGFERRHHKIQVTVMYNDSVVILVTVSGPRFYIVSLICVSYMCHCIMGLLMTNFGHEYSMRLKHFFERRFSLRVFNYHGHLPEREKTQQMREYLKRPSRLDSESVMVATVAATAVGLNITNGVDSPTAHVEFEQAPTGTMRVQSLKRIDRDGNPHAVQLITLTGTDTLEAKVISTQEKQAVKQAKAGAPLLEKTLLTISARQPLMS